jgi:hypothetical protein
MTGWAVASYAAAITHSPHQQCVTSCRCSRQRRLPCSSSIETRFRNQSFIRTGTDAFFLGVMGACGSSADALFGTTGAGAASSVGRGRGKGVDDAARW